MLRSRIITALVLAVIAIGAICYLPISFFCPLILLVLTVGAWEWAQFVPFMDRKASFLLLIVIINTIVLSWAYTYKVILALAAFWWLSEIVYILFQHKINVSLSKIKQNCLILLAGVFTLAPLGVSLCYLKAGDDLPHNISGSFVILLICTIVWATDIGAFFVGKKIGKNKLAPKISPNKTIEGMLGGVICGLVVAISVVCLLQIEIANWPVFLIAVSLTIIAAIFGDLSESLFKRMAGVKDSGNILPGHGGVLDRIDSLCAAFPVFLVIWVYFQF